MLTGCITLTNEHETFTLFNDTSSSLFMQGCLARLALRDIEIQELFDSYEYMVEKHRVAICVQAMQNFNHFNIENHNKTI